MAVNANTTTSDDINASLDIDMVENFKHEYDRLAEILGIATVETVAAGTALNQLKVTGELNDAKTDASSSGDSYVEGDLVALSKYKAEKVPVGEVVGKPYRKQTTAQTIQKSGYIPSIVRTDDKMVKDIRGKIVSNFFTYLMNGTGKAEYAGAKSLQKALSFATSALLDALENNGDESSSLVHFVNRYDVAAYLAEKDVTIQTVFGMTYIENFLGVERMFVSSKIPQGKLAVTPAENIRVFGIDFGTLSQAGLPYTTDADGLIGVNHEPGYDRVSVYTNVLYGAEMFAEVLDYIVIAATDGTVSAAGSSGTAGDSGTTGAGTQDSQTIPTV